ncbi:MAG: penicillin acylase family protein, partial [Acidobacteria bacterium]|nr:penicillin acylase family protein [Acidobacteriota bacterium]
TMLAGGLKDKVELLFPLRTGREIQPGSNAWAVAGTHTATGKALLSNDPHLGWTMPSTWHAVRILAPGLQVAGVALPGVPGVIIGHNRDIAWGVTNLGFDVQDLYQEKVDLQGLRYEYQGQVFPLLVDRDVIQVRGERPRNFDLALTRHGPLIELQGNQALALRWIASEPGSFQFPFIELNRAANWEQFRAALKRFPGPGQNFVYADREGNIGYQAAGLLPIRKGALGDTPVVGWTGENEWTGVIPFDELPTAYNPPSGYIVTANQNPFPADYKYPVHGDFSATYRTEQIRGLLAARPRISAADMTAVQTDVYSSFSKFLAGQFVKAYDAPRMAGEFPDLAGAIEQLRSWDGLMERGKAAPMIAVLGFQRVRAAVGEKASVGRGSVYTDQYAPVVIENLLRTRPKGWFEDWNRMLLQQLTLAIEEGRTLQGSLPEGWDYGEYNAVSIPNPVVSRIPGIGEWLGYFSIGPVPMAGSSNTVKQTTKNIGPSMRFTADVADWEQSRLNLTIGESGHLLSPNYKDQWEAYWSGGSTVFAFEKAESRHVLQVLPGNK